MSALKFWLGVCLTLLIAACDQFPAEHNVARLHEEESNGEHGGKILSADGLELEITIFEQGVPPEYRVWPSHNGKAIDPQDVDLTIRLERLGDIHEEVQFSPQKDFLRGDIEIYEPHSFIVNVAAKFRAKEFTWQYESFEGRTEIAAATSAEAGVKTELVGPAVIREHFSVYGQIVPSPQGISHVVARFDGVIQSVDAALGEPIKKGQRLATIEANDSLNSYRIVAPISGTVIERHANAGEATNGRTLFTILNTSEVWAELAIFPTDRPRVKIGLPVTVRSAIGEQQVGGTIEQLMPVSNNAQAISARVQIDNRQGLFASGMYVTGDIEVAKHEVPLAVKRSGLQKFRDYTVVFAQFDETYEVRMLDLGRKDDTWVEVLEGISAGTPYVTENSYLIKADVEKSGAAHDH